MVDQALASEVSSGRYGWFYRRVYGTVRSALRATKKCTVTPIRRGQGPSFVSLINNSGVLDSSFKDRMAQGACDGAGYEPYPLGARPPPGTPRSAPQM